MQTTFALAPANPPVQSVGRQFLDALAPCRSRTRWPAWIRSVYLRTSGQRYIRRGSPVPLSNWPAFPAGIQPCQAFPTRWRAGTSTASRI